MKKLSFELELPCKAFNQTFTEGNLLEWVKEQLCIKLFKEDRISASNAARLLGMQKREFFKRLYPRDLVFYPKSTREDFKGKSVLVVDSNPLISEISATRRARQLYDELIIPEAVYYEVVIQGEGRPGSAALEGAVLIGGIGVLKPQNQEEVKRLLNKGLKDGESEAIVLAQELAGTFYSEDRVAVQEAQRQNLPVIRTQDIQKKAFLPGA